MVSVPDPMVPDSYKSYKSINHYLTIRAMIMGGGAATLGSRHASFVRLVRGGWVTEDGKWLTTAQVARLLHVEPITVWRLAKDGVLAHRLTPGGHRRFDPHVVEAYIAAMESEQRD
jgi:excisionase family DNA binding protein